MRQPVHTDQAPKALGTYSQAIRADRTLYLAGQTGIDPATGRLAEGGFEAQAHQVFRNLAAVARAAGSSLDQAVKVGVFLTDFADFPKLNEIMAQYFAQPYPARTTIQAAGLPLGARVEADAILVTP